MNDPPTALVGLSAIRWVKPYWLFQHPAGVAEDKEIVMINWRGADDVALVSADELATLTETAHLLRSPKNAKRLLAALNRARKKTIKPKSPSQLRREMGLKEKA